MPQVCQYGTCGGFNKSDAEFSIRQTYRVVFVDRNEKRHDIDWGVNLHLESLKANAVLAARKHPSVLHVARCVPLSDIPGSWRSMKDKNVTLQYATTIETPTHYLVLNRCEFTVPSLDPCMLATITPCVSHKDYLSTLCNIQMAFPEDDSWLSAAKNHTSYVPVSLVRLTVE